MCPSKHKLNSAPLMVRGTPRRGEEIVIKEQPYLTHLLQSIATLFFILSEERVLFASAPFVLMSHIPEYPKCEDVYKLLLKVEEVDLRAERVKTEEYV